MTIVELVTPRIQRILRSLKLILPSWRWLIFYQNVHHLTDLEGEILGDRAGQAEDVDGQAEHAAIVEVGRGSQPVTFLFLKIFNPSLSMTYLQSSQ